MCAHIMYTFCLNIGNRVYPRQVTPVKCEHWQPVLKPSKNKINYTGEIPYILLINQKKPNSLTLT